MTDFVRLSVLQQLNQIRKMEIAKVTALLFSSLNIMLYFGAWFTNLENTKSSILFIMAVIMTGYRFWRWRIDAIQKSFHKRQMDQFERWERELQLREKENATLKQQLEIEVLTRRLNDSNESQ